MPSRATSPKVRGVSAGRKGAGRRSKHEPVSVVKGVGSGSRQPHELVMEATPRKKTGKKRKSIKEVSTDEEEGTPVGHPSKTKAKAKGRGKRQSQSQSKRKSIDDIPSSPLAARTPLRPLEPFPMPKLSVNDILRRFENDTTPRPARPLGLKTVPPIIQQSTSRDGGMSSDDLPTIKKLSRPGSHRTNDLAGEYTYASAGPSKMTRRPSHLDETSFDSPDPLALDDTSSDSEFVYSKQSKPAQASRLVPPPTPSPSPASSSKSTSRRTLVPCSSSPSTSSRPAKVQPFPLPPPARTPLVDDIDGDEDMKRRKRHRKEPLLDDGKMSRSPLADLSPQKQRTRGTQVVRGPQPKRRELRRTSSSDFAEVEASAPARARGRGRGRSRDEEDAPDGDPENAEAKRVRPRRKKTKTEGDLFFEEMALKKPSSPIGPAAKAQRHFQSEEGGTTARTRRDSSTKGMTSAKVVLDVTEDAGVLVDLSNANDATPRARAAKDAGPSEAVLQLQGIRSDFENELAAGWGVGEDGEEGQDGEDDEIDLSLYVDPDDLCPFCSEPMPTTMSPELMSLEIELRKISKPCPTSDNPNARKINWQKSIDFCSLHDAQAKVIPRGIKAGYPASIDFLAILARLETRWIRNALGSIAKYPHRYSTLFHAVEKDIGRIGKRNWSAAGHQSNREVMTATDVGYYGSLGKEVITRHTQHLLSWGCFPTLRPSDRGEVRSCEPLSAHDFVSHILVPEASILLIMEDLGWRGAHQLGSEQWIEARIRAVTVWRKSREYGRGRFGEGMEGGRAVLKEVQMRLEGMRDEIEVERRGYEVRKKRKLDKRRRKGEAQEPIIISDDEIERIHELASVGHTGSSQASSAADAYSDTGEERVRCLQSTSGPRRGVTPRNTNTGRSTRKSKSRSASPSRSGKAGRWELEAPSSFDDVESFGLSDVDEIYARMDDEAVRAGRAR